MQWVTLIIIFANVASFLIFNVGGAGESVGENFFALAFGHVPSVSYDLRTLPADYQIVPDTLYALTALTSAFMHGDFWHLAGNMLFLWVFGDNVEDALGHFKYLLFYVLCSFAAAYFHAFIFHQSDAPLIGASGAASGIVAAYLMLHPKMKVWVLFLSRIPLRLPAIIVLGGWIAFQIFMFLTDTDNEVSWAAHVGGILAGLVLTVVLKRRSVPLFDREIQPPRAAHVESETPVIWGRR